jgi:hypothetical protein
MKPIYTPIDGSSGANGKIVQHSKQNTANINIYFAGVNAWANALEAKCYVH